MSDTPRTDEFALSGKGHLFDQNDFDFCADLERQLNVETEEKIKYRERAWRAESQIKVRYGLRNEINTELGLTDETGDDALRKGLETIKALKSGRGWIKISDCMPAKDAPVLILAKMYYSGEPIICTATYDRGYWFTHGASGHDCEPEFDSETITHWMPLPNPPKEKS